MKQKLTYRHDGEKGTAMTYLEILGWARKGLQAEKANYRQMQEKALEGQAHDIAGHCQERIDELMFYTECWRELRSFLSEVVRDNTGEYPFAQDVLNLMRSIERKYERC